MSFTISSLSEDPINNIFSFLDVQALGRCCQVNQTWSTIANRDGLWRDLFPDVVVPSGMSLKKYLGQVVVLSEDKLLQKIKDFFSRVPVNQIGKFKCLFPFNPECKIDLKLGYFNVKGKAFLQETCLVGRKIPYKPGDVENYSSTFILTQFSPLFDRPVFSRFQPYSISIVYEMTLPSAKKSDDKFVDQIKSVLDSRMKELRWEAVRQDGNYIFGNAAKIAVIVAIALNTCFPLTY